MSLANIKAQHIEIVHVQKLSGTKIIDKDYDQVVMVWDRFQMKTMKNYPDFSWNVMFYW